MARGTACNEIDAVWNLLAGLDRGVPHSARFARDIAAFRVAELRVDRREVLVDEVFDADARRALLARFGEKNHVAIERHIRALERQHCHQGGRHVVLVVERASPVHVTALAHGAEGRVNPLLRIHVDDVRMSHDQERPFAAGAREACNDVRPVRLEREHLHRDALAFEHAR